MGCPRSGRVSSRTSSGVSWFLANGHAGLGFEEGDLLTEQQKPMEQGWRVVDLFGVALDVGRPDSAWLAELSQAPLDVPMLAELSQAPSDTPVLGGSSMPSIELLANVQKRKRRSSSLGSRTTKNRKASSTEDPDLLQRIVKAIDGVRLQNFILFEGGISNPSLRLVEDILQTILTTLGITGLDEGTWRLP